MNTRLLVNVETWKYLDAHRYNMTNFELHPNITGQIKMAQIIETSLLLIVGQRAQAHGDEVTFGAITELLLLRSVLKSEALVYTPGTSVDHIVNDGVSRDFSTQQIILEAWRSGYLVTEDYVNQKRKALDKALDEDTNMNRCGPSHTNR